MACLLHLLVVFEQEGCMLTIPPPPPKDMDMVRSLYGWERKNAEMRACLRMANMMMFSSCREGIRKWRSSKLCNSFM
ncbi:hypothetical protein B0H67DRAFT_111761 [Lasiosphaeris hirsuta]|uniref:Uncharacterized protein n=1 Tax=Lasiosphaeris hirsuta TaxID=260670 RepID=A0AA40E4G6_9PEZI|nr:hypothetical protein B0H67DRAFT_111761 [Lasiosphaeris hirsuta]